MSKGWNRIFAAHTQGFIRQNLMTAAGMTALPAGPVQLDLQHHLVGADHVVRLDASRPLSADEGPLTAWWVPQGAACVVPKSPGPRAFVFTPDFSGCSILVDQIDASYYRIYHVQGGEHHLQREYLSGTQGAHGLGLAAAMTFDDYGTHAEPRAFAFLKFESDRWWIYVQGQRGVGLGYVNGRFIPMGAQTIRSGARIPVVDLTCEVPRTSGRHGGRHSGHDLPPPPRHLPSGPIRRLAPNEQRW